MDGEWQPAVIAPKEHVLQFHMVAGPVSNHAGKLIRVRINQDTLIMFQMARMSQNGCRATTSLEVHPDDAVKLWPEEVAGGYRITICEHCVLTD